MYIFGAGIDQAIPTQTRSRFISLESAESCLTMLLSMMMMTMTTSSHYQRTCTDITALIGRRRCDVGYDERVQPDIVNCVATAAMRFGHTQIQGMVNGRDASYNVISNSMLSTVND